MKSLLMFIASFLGIILFSSQAQAETKIKPIRMELSAKAHEVPVLSTQVRGNMQKARHDTAMASIRNIRALAPSKPKPLAKARLMQLTQKPAGGSNTQLKAPATPVLKNLKLSSRKNYHGFGSLALNEVRHIYGLQDYALFYTATDPTMAYVQARIKVEKGARYLIDWLVKAPQSTVFSVSAGGSHQFSVGKGDHHLLAYLDSDVDGWTTISVHSDTANYGFYSVEITKVE